MSLIDHLDLSILPRAERRRIERAFAKARDLESGLRKLDAGDRMLLEQLLDRRGQLVSLDAVRAESSRPPWGNPDRLRQWLRPRLPPMLLEAAVYDVLDYRFIQAHRLWGIHYVEELVWHAGQKAVQQWFLEQVAQQQRVVGYHNRAEAWRSQRPEGVLQPLWNVLYPTRKEVLDEVGGPVVGEDHKPHFVLRDEPLALWVGHDGYLLLDDEDLAIGWPDQPREQLEVVTSLLDAITAPHHEPIREQLTRALSQPVWLRKLERLTKNVRPEPLPPDEDKTLSGWEVVVGDIVQVLPVRCRRTNRGTYVTKRLPRNEVLGTSVLFTDPTDADLLEACAVPGPRALRETLRALRGHPRVFASTHSTKVPLRIVEGELALGVRVAGPGAVLRLEWDGQPLNELSEVRIVAGCVLFAVDEQSVRFAWLDAHAVELFRFFQHQPQLQLPDAEALRHLRHQLPVLAQQLSLQVDESLLGLPVQGDQRPLVACQWTGGELRLEAHIAPLPDVPPATPGRGSSAVFVERDGELLHVVRELEAEPGRVQQALAPLELPESAEVRPFTWALQDPQQALETFERLDANREALQLRWLGDPPRAPGRVGADKLKLRVGSGVDWFGLDGELSYRKQKVSLEAAMAAAAEGHRFVAVGKDRWVRLEEDLRKALSELAAVQEKGQLGALHGAVVEGLEAQGASVEAPEDWRARRQAAARAVSLEVATPPTLQASLRDYQREGFVWLARLASWAPGACLADDMGLGKTVQSIALLLHRREHGPALVVAPTSVVDNWAAELERFAPGLTVAAYRGQGREALLGERPDVLLTSYGLLARDAEALQAEPWGTVVLDEAQAIRNPVTQRARAAQGLQAGFALALSGTPVQNQTSELWSLMAFAAPGLLGSEAHFRQQFVVPIEHHRDLDRRALLARLVAPFVLRRTKGQVALELPPRTDQLVRVELSAEEQALYERARADALVRLGQAGKNRSFQVLQELLRLRQLACHPRLFDPDSTVTSSKLRQVVRTLLELRAAGHKALVFSSFTSHLALVRHALEERGLVLRYLDGSTSVARRAEEVASFQAGEGDAFLISLKAGGTGLNLTQATYVLHLDPWWNPAAEDQASDRAHRIGQDQPVTVYRFVSAGTIEEQIVALHQRKRELAEALLSASGSTEHLDTDALVALLQTARAPELAPPSPPPPPARPVLALVPPPAEEPEPTAALSGEAMLDAFSAWLDAQHAAGAIARQNTVRSYLRTVDNLVRWCTEQGLHSASEVLDNAERYVVLSKAGGGLSKSDKTVARPAVSKLRSWWQER